MPDPTAPVGERGGPGGYAQNGWNHFTQEGEHVPELRWPESVKWHERMLTDSQVWALFSGTALPLLDYAWWLEPGDADTAMVDALAADLGLPVGEPDADQPYPSIGPGLFRFNFTEHLYEALLALCFGHYYFEQVGIIDGGLWHLRKLGPRAPATIEAFDIAPDGGLRAIQQSGAVVSTGAGGVGMFASRVPPITVDRLVAYVWQSDARCRWVGRSLLRPLYRHWLVKDRLIRVDAINHERAGGVPYVTTDETYQGQSLDELQQLASEFRVGEEGGAALPPGADLKLARAGGTDIIASLNYHDDSMARVWQAQVRQLAQGGDSANRAVGQTFEGLEDQARRAIARWFAGVFREHVIEDWWTWNLGPGTPHPVLACRPPAGAGAAPSPVMPPPAPAVAARARTTDVRARAAGCQAPGVDPT